MVPPSGTCVSVRVARSSMPADAVAANALAALQGVVKHIPKKWANVQVRGRGRGVIVLGGCWLWLLLCGRLQAVLRRSLSSDRWSDRWLQMAVCVTSPATTPRYQHFILLHALAAAQAVYLKTNESVALPVYQVLPDAPTKIAAVQQQ